MTLMNRLEALPHTWFRSADLELRELATAIRCYTAGHPWEPIDPFADSYVDTLLGLRPHTPAYYRARSLAEIVWDLFYGEGQIIDASQTVQKLPQWLTENRAAILATDDAGYQRGVKLAFGRAVRAVGAALPEFAKISADEFIECLWRQPNWCPASRLSFEVSQLFQADTMTRGRESDIEDLVRIKAVPYVNVFVGDASKRAYLEALRSGTNSRLRACDYWATCTVSASLENERDA